MAPLVIRTLGQPAVRHAGAALALPTRKSLALLLYLAVEGGQTREHLAALLWPESEPEAGRAALRNTLTFVRRALSDGQAEHLRASRAWLDLARSADLSVDMQLLESAAHALRSGSADLAQLQAALESYGGDFLAGFALSDAPEFDNWAAVQRERAHQLIEQVAEALVAGQRAARDIPAAIATLSRWIAINPLHEPAYLELVRLQLASGDRAAARRTDAAYRAMLAREFGVEPEPLALAQVPAPPRPPPDQPARPPRLELPFSGRELEHHALTALFARVRRGETLAVRLEGEAGVGKTRLVHEVLRWAAGQGADVVRGRAFEASSRVPYQPFTDAWRDWLDRERAPSDLLADVWLVELTRLFPELRERYPDLERPTADDPGAQGRFYEAAARLGLAAARRAPLVLVLDDLQWADDATRDLMLYAARRWRDSGAPILLILAVRSEDLGPRGGLSGWFGDLARACPVERVALAPLATAAIQSLVRRLLGVADTADGLRDVLRPQAESFALWLQRESGGVPFFLAEMIAALLDRGALVLRPEPGDAASVAITPALRELDQTQRLLPAGVRDVLRARLAPLSEAAFSLLGAAAILGQRSTFAELCRVAELDTASGLAELDELLDRRLLQLVDAQESALDSPAYIVAHDKIRDVVYTEVGAARRQLLHGRALTVLEEQGVAPSELARHALAAQRIDAAWRSCLAAGDAAMQLFAVSVAAAHYEQARRLLPRLPGAPLVDQLYLRLGRAYELLNQLDAAHTAHQELLAHARRTAQPELIVGALNRLATIAVQRGEPIAPSRDLLAEAQALAERHRDDAGLAETAWNLAQLSVYSWDPAAAIVHGQQALTIARRLGRQELIARALNVLALGCHDHGNWGQMERHAAEAAQLYATLQDRAMEADSLVLVGNARVMAGRVQEGIAAGRQALAIAQSLDTPWGQVHAMLHLALALIDGGWYDQALAVATAGAILAEQHRIVPLLPYALSTLGTARRAVLQLDTAIEAHQAALAANAAVTYQPFTEMIQSELCADYALAGAWPEAHQHARDALAVRRYELRALGLTRWHETTAMLAAGDTAGAYEDAARFLDTGAAAGAEPLSPRFELAHARVRAVLARHAGDREGAYSTLEQAATLAETLEVPGEHWQILIEHGRCAAELGRERQSRAAFAEARRIVGALADAIGDAELRVAFEKAAGSHFLREWWINTKH
jgi:DNA-binding SARP family transcriptional activator/predicted ATPase